MNLLDIKRKKRKLKFIKGLCFLMTFVSITCISKQLKNMINKVDFFDLDNTGVELIIDQEDYFKQEFISATTLAYSSMTSKETVDVVSDSLDAEDVLEEKDYGVSKKILDKAVDLAIDKVVDNMLENYDINQDIEQILPNPYQQKMLIIMERDGYTYEELDAVCAGCVAESYGDGNCYDEGYDIASIFHNRTHSNAFVTAVSATFGENAGYSYYNQLRAPGQFGVWSSGSYKKYLGRTDLLAYQAAIDMFYSGVPSHNYLNFNYKPPKSGSYEQLNPPYGNYYSRVQNPNDVIATENANELVLSLKKN